MIPMSSMFRIDLKTETLFLSEIINIWINDDAK